MLIKQKVLSAEYNINVTTHPVIDTPEGRLCDNSGHKSRDIHDGTTRDVHASTTREPTVHSTKVENKVLTAHEEAVRNRSKVLSNEFHLEVKAGQPKKSNIGDISDANQEAKNNRERSQGGSDMNQCMRNVITETSKDPIQTCTPSVLVDPHPSELSSSIGPSTKESTDQELTDDPMTTSHSVTSSSENLVTIISKEEQSSEETQEETAKTSPPRGYVLETKQSHYKINTAWTFNSLIDENEDLDVTLVQKYLERSIRIPLYIQYRLTNDAVLRLFLNKHHLATHLITLRNYFFLLDGSFAKSLTHDLSKQIRNNLVLLLNPFKLNSILRKAVSYGTCDTKMENNLTFVIKNYDTISSLQESNVFQYISLSYKVEWPLNIVLTPEALTNYDKVFVFLMQVQQVSHTLQEVFVYLKLRRKFEMNNLYIYRQ
ncbi:gamma-tubulin complex component 6, partial [Diaphorina citri]|uniref:Gamma-tubulin complex component n=1 Tax=Diaphorina citri TaxID=121845 RepID=A0A1S3DRN0_DIACI